MGSTETMLERATRAAMDDMKRQLDGQAIPGVPDVAESWSATGDVQSIDMASVVRAVLDALETPTPGMIEAGARDDWERNYTTQPWDGGDDGLVRTYRENAANVYRAMIIKAKEGGE